jgi:transposase
VNLVAGGTVIFSGSTRNPARQVPVHRPDFKTIADFRRDNGAAIRRVCAEFVVLCRQMKLFTESMVAIDGSKFKAVNNRDRNFTEEKIKSRMAHL